jgi:hypothetical protein
MPNDEAQWNAVVTYGTGAELQVVELPLAELEDLRVQIERGPHWHTIKLIQIRRVNHLTRSSLTAPATRV